MYYNYYNRSENNVVLSIQPATGCYSRSNELLNSRSNGLLNSRSNGLLNSRSNGLLNYRSNGLLNSRSNGLLHFVQMGYTLSLLFLF